MNRRLVLMSAAAAVLGVYVLTGEGGLLSGLLQPSAPESGVGQPGEPQAVSPAGGAPREGIKLNPLQGLDPQSFPAIVEQPLFNPGRSPRPTEAPPPVEVAASPEPTPEPMAEKQGPVAADYRLLAVSSGPSGRVAALRLNQSGEVLYVREGQEVQQWRVIAVGPRSLTIGTPEQNVELAMFENMDDPAVVPSDASAGDDGEMPNLPTPPSMPTDPMPEGGN